MQMSRLTRAQRQGCGDLVDRASAAGVDRMRWNVGQNSSKTLQNQNSPVHVGAMTIVTDQQEPNVHIKQ